MNLCLEERLIRTEQKTSKVSLLWEAREDMGQPEGSGGVNVEDVLFFQLSFLQGTITFYLLSLLYLRTFSFMIF